MTTTTLARRAALAITLLATSLTTASLARAQTIDPEAASQVRFTRGRQFFSAGQFEQALGEFRAALELVRSPNIRLNLARTLRQLNRFAEAYNEYMRSAAEASDRASSEARFAATRDTARTEANEILPRIGRLMVSAPNAPPGTTISVGGTGLPAAGWGIAAPYDPRDVEVTATAPGYLAFRQTVTVRATAESSVTVTLRVDPDAARRAAAARAAAARQTANAPVATVPTEMRWVGGAPRLVGAVLMVIGGLGVGGGGIFGAMAQARYDDLRRRCGGLEMCGQEFNGELNSGQTLVTLSNIALFGGGGLLGVGLIMVAVGGPHRVEVPVRPTAFMTLGPEGLPRAVLAGVF